MTSINELKKACKRKDLNTIKSIIDQSPNFINELVYDSDGNTLLMKACLEGWDEIVKYLISNYSNIININQQNEEGKSALYQAVSKGNENCARELLSHPGINVNLQSNEGKSALYRAVSNDEVACVRVLLSHPDIDVNLQHEEWKKPVLWYCKNRECYDLLLPYYPLMKEHEKTMAWIWIIYKNRIGGLNEVKEIFQPFTNVSLSEMRDDISKLVLIAATRGDKNMLQYLLSFSGDVININILDEEGESALYKAVSKGNVDCVKILLSHPDIDVNLQKDGESALYEAVSEGNVDCVKELLSHPRINVNHQCKDGETALYKAVSGDEMQCVKLLLSHPDINLNLRHEEWNKTVLWYCENRECFDLLLPYYPLMKEHEKTMAWIWAMYCNDNGGVSEVKDLMEQISRDMLHEMRDDVSMLMVLAAEKGDKKMIKYLLSSHGDIININIQNNAGESALYKAVSEDEIQCVKLLLSHPNIDVNLQYGEWNKTVLWYCENRKCFDLLLPRYPEMKEHEKTMAWIWVMYKNRIGGLNEAKEIMDQFSKDVASEMRNDVSMLLLIVAERGDKDMLEYLLSSYGDIININIQNKDGRTPLHLAIYNERRDCIDILRNRKNIDGTIRDKDGKTADEMKSARRKVSEIELVERNPSMMDLDLLSQQKIVKWNRSKIMFVGQGRAGKTALANNLAGIWIEDTKSTIGAEMEMKILYGGVKGGKLQEYKRPERETEALLAEELHSKNQKNQKNPPRTRNPETSSKSLLMGSPQVESQRSSIEQPESQKKEMSFIIPLKPSDIKPEKVEIHYRQLQEVDTASNYKLLLVDFGGQSLFNILHGFFMSRYGIYLVVFDMELFLSKEKSKKNSCHKELRFWLNSIAMHTLHGSKGKAAPVAIVGTRGDKISNEADHETISLELEEMFGDMMVWKSLILNEDLCFFPNNNTLTENNPVSARLLRFIERSLENADYLQSDIPILWIKIFDEMRSLQQSYLSYEEVIRISREKYQDVRESLIEHEEDVEEVDRKILIQVKEMLRFLNGMGMLMWIEEKDLEDVIILDPIEYLVKPVTTIICKHLATKDDPYGTIHHIEEIHGESREEYGEDWERMLESGFVSEELANGLLKRYYGYRGRAADPHLIKKILQFILKFGLMILSSIASRDKSDTKAFYLVPSLLPTNPSILCENKRDRGINKMIRRLHVRYGQMCTLWSNVGVHFSLFCFLPQKGLSRCKGSGGYDIISSSELAQQGFLPHSLFERMFCRFIQRYGYDENSPIGFRGKVQLSYQHHDIRMTERQEENRIEVIVKRLEANRLSSADKEREKDVFVEIYQVIVEMMELSLRECFEGLQVKTLIHLPHIAATPTSSKEEGFITLSKVRELLSASDTFQMARALDLISHDGTCKISLIPEDMQNDSYWSVWKEKVNIPILPANSSSTSILREGEKTYVFLSHDWGIDDNNHHRVKEISDVLKSRGLVTWIDDENIVNDIDRKIIDGIDHTECMIVFLTENYVRKVDGKNDKDYCKREFNYGFEKLGKDKILVVVLDESLKDRSKWGSTIPFNLGSVLYVDMTASNNSMNDLYQRILKIVEESTTIAAAESKTPVEESTTIAAAESKTPVEESTTIAAAESKTPVEESTTIAAVEVEELALFIEVPSYHVFLFLLVFTVLYSYLLLQLSFE